MHDTYHPMKQLFYKPKDLPFLEVRTTLGSIMPYAAHFHMTFSLGIILEGRTCFFLDDKPNIAEVGDIVFIAPGRVHSCNPIGGEPRGYHMLYFDATWFKENISILAWGDCSLHLSHPLITDPVLYAQALRLVASLQSGVATENMFSAFLSSVLLQSKAEPMLQNVHNEFHLPTADFTCCTIAELAKKAKMRRESFSRRFRRVAGLSPQSYLHCLRIEKGRQLLWQGKGIAETAFETGYTDQSHFHRMFVRIVSATPGCYQKKAVTFVQER